MSKIFDQNLRFRLKSSYVSAIVSIWSNPPHHPPIILTSFMIAPEDRGNEINREEKKSKSKFELRQKKLVMSGKKM